MSIQHLRSAKIGLALLALSLTLWSAGCASQPPAPKIVPLPPMSFAGRWTAPLKLGDDVLEHVFVRDDMIFIYTSSHRAYLIDRESGNLRFMETPTRPDMTLHPPVVLKDFVVYPTTVALEIYDRHGKWLRRGDLKEVPMGTNAVGVSTGTKVFFGGDSLRGGRAVCEELAGGKYLPIVESTLYCRGSMISAPAYFQGLMFVADSLGDVYGVNADSMAPVWGLEQPDREKGVFGSEASVKADLAADAYGVYVASMDTKLYCLDRTKGLIRWQYFAGVPLKHTPAVTESTVYIYVDGIGLVAIEKVVGPEKHDQKPKWIVPNALSLLSEDDRFSYLQRNDNAIMAVDKATGQIKFVSKRHDFVHFGLNNKDSTIFAATADGNVFAIKPVLRAGQVGEEF